MSQRYWLALFGLTLILGTVLVLVMAQSGNAGPSSLARGPDGLFASRRYLEARGAEVTLLDHPFDELESGGVVITAFPWPRQIDGRGLDPVLGYVRQGGTLVLAYSGTVTLLTVPDAGEIPLGLATPEIELLELLGLDLAKAREDPPLSPLKWREYARAQWRAEPEASLGARARSLVLPALRSLPSASPAAQIWYRQTDQGAPVAFSVSHGRGQVVVIPAAVLSNAYLDKGGNADLLESLRTWLGDRWIFDEYHHGLVDRKAAGVATSEGVFDLMTLHLGLIYVLGLATLARRFGSPWREPPVRSGSTTAFLRGLGALHHRLGHYQTAARLLLARVKLLEPHLEIPEELSQRADATAPEHLVDLAKAVAKLRAEGKRRG